MIATFHKIEVNYDTCSNITEVEQLCSQFEWYLDTITNREDLKQARMKNVFILRKLIEFGINGAIIYGYMDLQGKVSNRVLITNGKIG